MLKYVLMTLLSLFLWQPQPVLANDQISEILQGVRKNYGHLPGLTVTYKREILTKSMAMLGETTKADLATGRFYFKPPYFLKVQQETPKVETVISDGETLWWYVPHKKQVFRYPSNKLGKELRLLSDIFHGLRKVEESFDVTLTSDDPKKGYHLKLTPNPPWQEVQYINLLVVRGSYAIRMVENYNYLGGVTRFILGDISVQEKFEEDFFRFVPPEGVKVIEE
ncbi:MAG: outer membrane lipoprotein carrier protein LolA [Desulfatiglandales bacterium]